MSRHIAIVESAKRGKTQLVIGYDNQPKPHFFANLSTVTDSSDSELLWSSFFAPGMLHADTPADFIPSLMEFGVEIPPCILQALEEDRQADRIGTEVFWTGTTPNPQR